MRALALALLVTTVACGGSAPEAPAPASAAAPATPAPAASAAPAASEAAAAPAAFVRNVDAAGAAAWLQEHPDTVILDVRTPEEYADAHLHGATLVDYKAPDFNEKVAALDKSKTYLLHCRSGRRSAEARDLMQGMGFQSLVHLDGGIEAWQAAGQPVEK